MSIENRVQVGRELIETLNTLQDHINVIREGSHPLYTDFIDQRLIYDSNTIRNLIDVIRGMNYLAPGSGARLLSIRNEARQIMGRIQEIEGELIENEEGQFDEITNEAINNLRRPINWAESSSQIEQPNVPWINRNDRHNRAQEAMDRLVLNRARGPEEKKDYLSRFNREEKEREQKHQSEMNYFLHLAEERERIHRQNNQPTVLPYNNRIEEPEQSLEEIIAPLFQEQILNPSQQLGREIHQRQQNRRRQREEATNTLTRSIRARSNVFNSKSGGALRSGNLYQGFYSSNQNSFT